MLDRNVHVLLCIMWHVISHVYEQFVFFQIHLSKVLNCVRLLSLTYLLTCTEIRQLLAVSSRILVQTLDEKFCIMEKSMVSVLCLCVQKNKTSSVNTRKRN